MSLLEVRDLQVTFRLPGRRTAPLHAVDHVDLDIQPGQSVGLVGESGSGKSTIGRSILGLIQPAGGTINFDGSPIVAASLDQRRRLGRQVQAVFQDPYNSLDPLRTIGHTLTEPLSALGIAKGRDAERIAVGVLAKVGMPAETMQRKPRQFSGGQRQRIAIARALVVSPRLIVCDEAISALDLSTQAQVLNLFVDLRNDLGVAYLFIAHDLTVVRHVSDRVVVLYRGQVMEAGSAAEVCDSPVHPYSRALWSAAPTLDPAGQRDKREVRTLAVREAASSTPSIPVDQVGCPFAPRCPYVLDICHAQRPPVETVNGRSIACHVFGPSSTRQAITPVTLSSSTTSA